jgi:hypothetical protein
MLEYRDRISRTEGQSAQSGADPIEHQDTSEMPKYMSLAEQYGFSDDMDIGGSTDNGTEQTVEQEYLAYITAPPSSKTVDILKFWEVGSTVVFMALWFLTAIAG